MSKAVALSEDKIIADIQHQNIPDEYLHEVKHALNANPNQYLRSKGDGTTEFVSLDLSSFDNLSRIADDTTLETTLNISLEVGKQYVITLTKEGADNQEYQVDFFDLRGGFVPFGANTLLSVGGNVRYLSGQLQALNGYSFFRVVQVN